MRTRNTNPPELCTVADCGSKHLAKGFCRKHYKRVKKHGDAFTQLTPANGEAVNFARRLLSNPPETTSCIIWPFARSEKGHARINNPDGKPSQQNVSRWLLERISPSPSKKHLALHSCHKGHEGCVNPKHLYWGTQAQNSYDMVVAGRHPTQKITPEIAQAIWDYKGRDLSASAVAAKFSGASKNIVLQIWRGTTWSKHIVK